MAKSITKIVLTGGPAAGKTTLISRILKEFKREDGWRVITVPETATELISGFGIKPFDSCVTMEQFQYFVIDDQLHKERLALKAAQTVAEERIIIIYDRAVIDDKAYITDEQFKTTLSYFGKNEQEILAGYDAVLHLVTCAKGAEFAYNYGNAARSESIDKAREMDDLTLRAWSGHPNLFVVDNAVNFEDKINRAIARIYQVIGQEAPEAEKRKYLIETPDIALLTARYGASPVEMMQTYLVPVNPNAERRVRQQRSGDGYLYFYTEKRRGEDGSAWVTERPIAEREYVSLLMESDISLHPVRKTKYRFAYRSRRMEIDVYPFSDQRAILFVYGSPLQPEELPDELRIITDVTGNAEYKNRRLAATQRL